MPEYRETNGIPICPFCQKPTKRQVNGPSSTTLVYYTPTFDENGVNTNPDCNNTRDEWLCCDCGKSYTVLGNACDGYKYIGLPPEEQTDDS